MAFSADVKNELTKIELPSEGHALSELMGFVRTNGFLSINFQGDINLKFETTAAYTGRRIFKIVKDLYNYDLDISVVNDENLRKKNLYQARVDDQVSRYILEDCGYNIGDFGYLQVKDGFEIEKEVMAADFLRGAFLGAGSVTEPSKDYHLEIVCDTEESRKAIQKVAKNLEISFKESQRHDDFLLYLKDGDSISDLLSIMGANKAMLDFENVRAYKDLRNSVNRIVNAETANINKTVETSVRQINAIEKIEEEIGLDGLPDNLREIAILRLANPNASLKELGQRLPTPLGKSGVSHRLKKIEEIAESL